MSVIHLYILQQSIGWFSFDYRFIFNMLMGFLKFYLSSLWPHMSSCMCTKLGEVQELQFVCFALEGLLLCHTACWVRLSPKREGLLQIHLKCADNLGHFNLMLLKASCHKALGEMLWPVEFIQGLRGNVAFPFPFCSFNKGNSNKFTFYL